MDKKLTFLEGMNQLNKFGFWSDISKNTLISIFESSFKKDVLSEWFINDLIISDKKVLYEWKPRFIKLSDDELKEKYNLD